MLKELLHKRATLIKSCRDLNDKVMNEKRAFTT